MHFAQESGIYI